MAITISIAGSNYSFPSVNDEGWGEDINAVIRALADNTLQTDGGAFSLGSELDLGPDFGLQALYLKSKTSGVSGLGALRLAISDLIGWRNQANDGDNTLGTSNDKLQYNGNDVFTLDGTTPVPNPQISQESVTQHQTSIAHDALAGFVGDEHVNHASVSVTGGEGISGGGDLTASRTFDLDVDALSEDGSPDAVNDFGLFYDVSTSSHKKIKISDLLGAVGGIFNLGGQTGSTQSFAVGNSGSDFNISSDSNTHTFNIPDASNVNRGLVNTTSQTFKGIKTFSDGVDLGPSKPSFENKFPGGNLNITSGTWQTLSGLTVNKIYRITVLLSIDSSNGDAFTIRVTNARLRPTLSSFPETRFVNNSMGNCTLPVNFTSVIIAQSTSVTVDFASVSGSPVALGLSGNSARSYLVIESLPNQVVGSF